jgi:hypothetical protein
MYWKGLEGSGHSLIEVLSRNLPLATEKYYQNPHSGQPVSSLDSNWALEEYGSRASLPHQSLRLNVSHLSIIYLNYRQYSFENSTGKSDSSRVRMRFPQITVPLTSVTHYRSWGAMMIIIMIWTKITTVAMINDASVCCWYILVLL